MCEVLVFVAVGVVRGQRGSNDRSSRRDRNDHLPLSRLPSAGDVLRAQSSADYPPTPKRSPRIGRQACHSQRRPVHRQSGRPSLACELTPPAELTPFRAEPASTPALIRYTPPEMELSCSTPRWTLLPRSRSRSASTASAREAGKEPSERSPLTERAHS